MPEVHFIGDITHVAVAIPTVSLTWAILPGNTSWRALEGVFSAETHTCVTSADGRAVMSHPLDCHYEAATSDGWPVFVCEVWDKSFDGMRGFVGCGSAWLPSSPGKHAIDVQLWRPTSHGLSRISEMFLSSCPELKTIRELTVSPFLRSQILVSNMFSSLFLTDSHTSISVVSLKFCEQLKFC